MSIVHGVIGPMFSGKTSWLLRKLNYYSDNCMRVLYVNSKKDNRTIQVVDNQIVEANKFSSHSSTLTLSSLVSAIKITRLSEFTDLQNYDVIGVDELQFFDDAEVLLEWKRLNPNIRIIYACLDSDYLQRPFQNILPVLSGSKYKKKVALCDKLDHRMKNIEAPYTIRTSKGAELFQAGGKEHYSAVCRDCLISHSRTK